MISFDNFKIWKNEINSVCKNTPKIKFIKDKKAKKAVRSHKIAKKEVPAEINAVSSCKKNNSLMDNLNQKCGTIMELKNVEQIEKVSNVLKQYNEIVDKQRAQEIAKAELIVDNFDHIVPHIAVKKYNDFLSSKIPNPMADLERPTGITYDNTSEAKPSREREALEAFISRMAKGQLVVKNGVVTTCPSHKVILNMRKRLLEFDVEAKKMQREILSNANMIELNSKYYNKEQSYTLGQLSRQPLVQFGKNESNKKVERKNKLQHTRKRSKLINRPVQECITTKLKHYDNSKLHNKADNHHQNLHRKHQTHKTSYRNNIFNSKCIPTVNLGNRKGKEDTFEFSKIYKDFHDKYHNPYVKHKDELEKIDIGNKNKLMQTPTQQRFLKLEHFVTSCQTDKDIGKITDLKKSRVVKRMSDLLQLPDENFLQNINFTKREWKRLPKQQKMAYFKTEKIIHEVLSLRNKVAIQPKMSAF